MRLSPLSKSAIICLIFLLVLTRCSHAREVELEWDACDPAYNVVEYRMFNVGTNTLLGSTAETTITVEASTGDPLAVFAVNNVGLMSGPSNIVIAPDPDIPTDPPMSREGWLVKVSSEELAREDNSAGRAIDDSEATFWHSEWATPTAPPHYIQITLPQPATISLLYYLTRQDGHPNGRILEYEIQSSADGIEWELWATGKWGNDMLWKWAALPLREVRHIRIWSNAEYCAVGDLHLVGYYTPKPPSFVRLTMQTSGDLTTWADIAHEPIIRPIGEKESYRIKIETSP